MLTLDLAARVTAGLAMPDGSGAQTNPAGVVLLSCEDDLADTVLPRLRVAGADVSRIISRSEVYEGWDGRRPPTIGDIEHLADDIQDCGGKLVVVDPLAAFLGEDTHPYRDGEVRRALQPLADLAAHFNAAVVLVRHLRKQADGNPINAGGGSIGVMAAARVAFLCTNDRTDATGNRRVLAQIKTNVGQRAASLAFPLVEEEGIPRMAWEGRSELTAEMLLSRPAGEARGRPRDAAIEFLREELGDGPRPAVEVLEQAARMEISERTLRRAAGELGVRIERKGFGPGSCVVWSLP